MLCARKKKPQIEIKWNLDIIDKNNIDIELILDVMYLSI